MDEDLRSRLLAVAGVTNLVGQRVYFRVPQDATYPLIRMQLIGSNHHHDNDGAAGIAQALVQIDCIDQMVSDAKAVSRQVRLALQGFRGTQGDTNFRSILLSDQRDLDQPDVQGGETGHYGVSMDFTVTYVESIPAF